MADVFTKAKRSEVMARIRRRGNKATELALAKLFRRNRVKPDFVFRQVRLAVFVDGCFWHGCPKHATKPKNNVAFWLAKRSGNRMRDAVVNRSLRGAGWRVLRVWEHELAKKNEARLVRRLSAATGGCRGCVTNQ